MNTEIDEIVNKIQQIDLKIKLNQLKQKNGNNTDNVQQLEINRDNELNKLVILLIPFLYAIIKKLDKTRVLSDKDDMFNDGVIGLMNAINNYTPVKGVGFKTYAYLYIKGEIVRNRLKYAASEINEEYFKNKVVVSNNSDNFDLPIYDLIDETNYGKIIENKVLANELLDLADLSLIEREILSLKFNKNKTFSEISKIYDTDIPEITSVYNSCLYKLKRIKL